MQYMHFALAGSSSFDIVGLEIAAGARGEKSIDGDSVAEHT